MARPAGLHRARFVGAGLLDQVVIATANAATTLLGPILLSLHRSGLMILALGVGYLAMNLNRAFVGDVLIALASRHEGEDRDRLVRNGSAAAVAAGVLACAILLLVWVAWPRGGETDLRDLVWIAPFLPAVMLHDTGRCVYLADRRPQRALAIDLVWAGTQGAIITVLILADAVTAPGLLAAWGLGAVAGSVVFLVRAKPRPWRGSPRGWFTETRHLSGWFTATAVVAQLQVQAVTFVVAFRLSPTEVSGLRFVQTVQLQPVQNLITAAQGLLVPRASRQAAAGDRAALWRQVRVAVLAFAGLGVLYVAVAWPVVAWLLSRSDRFAPFAPLALPVALQAALYLLQVPFTAAMRGMHRARALFAQYLIFTTVSLTGLLAGAQLHGLLGAAWGLFIGAAAGFALMAGMFLYALREVAPQRPPSAGAAEPQSVAGSG